MNKKVTSKTNSSKKNEERGTHNLEINSLLLVGAEIYATEIEIYICSAVVNSMKSNRQIDTPPISPFTPSAILNLLFKFLCLARKMQNVMRNVKSSEQVEC